MATMATLTHQSFTLYILNIAFLVEVFVDTNRVNFLDTCSSYADSASFFWRPGRIVTMASPKRNYKFDVILTVHRP